MTPQPADVSRLLFIYLHPSSFVREDLADYIGEIAAFCGRTNESIACRFAAPDAPRVTIVDLGSTNGILVDGQRVQQATLEDGSTVKIGNTTMTVRFTGAREDG